MPAGDCLPELLESLYLRFNSRDWLDPDPLAVVLDYGGGADQELAGIVCAALALGSAPLIVAACRAALSLIRPNRGCPAPNSLSARLDAMDDSELVRAFAGFRYRFFDGADLSAFLCGIRDARRAYGSLEAAFLSAADRTEEDYAGAASRFVRTLAALSPAPWKPNLFPDPARGSAAKRVFLFLRWMVRRDAVDPGPWTRCDAGKLVVPLDTHMAAACRRLGFLTRKTTDLAAARQATAALRKLRPDDPVRYDFCMTRPGIRPDLDPDACFQP